MCFYNLLPEFMCFFVSESIHQWLRKVEEASDSAINNVLNPKVDKTKSYPNISNAGLSKKSGDPFSGN